MGKDNLSFLAGEQVGEKLIRLGNRMIEDLISSSTGEGFRHEVVAEGRIFEVITQKMSDDLKKGNILLVINDVTLERQVQRQLDQQERLATVGQMAAGLAHDFNNIMSIVALYARQDLSEQELPPKVRDHLRIITQQTDRASTIIQQILDFGRRAILERQPMDLALVINEQVSWLERMLPETIRLEFSKSEAEYVVNADLTRMQQVLLNLVLNARDAMPDGGVLEIKLTQMHINQTKLPRLPDIESGDWVCIAVRDNGMGIPPEILPHIYNPFFTTKPPGKGSGLGLAQVYGIVKQHDGHIDVESTSGEGTTFYVYLPVETKKPKKRPRVDKYVSLHGHGETILVVEDDDALLRALVEILTSLDYRVLGASNGSEALAILDEDAREVDLVLSDLVMPEMGGKELMQTIQQQGIKVPIVMMTGHPRENELLDLEADGLSGWLRKPPTIEQIAQLLLHLLKDKPT
jgi:signal transduction histidine kinase/ActR/RegA family two-component response regulator